MSLDAVSMMKERENKAFRFSSRKRVTTTSWGYTGRSKQASSVAQNSVLLPPLPQSVLYIHSGGSIFAAHDRRKAGISLYMPCLFNAVGFPAYYLDSTEIFLNPHHYRSVFLNNSSQALIYCQEKQHNDWLAGVFR